MGADRSRLPEIGPDPAFRLPTIVHQTLVNGLRIRAVEHHNVPVVTMVLQVAGGSGADPSSLEGLAAITADMADEGTGGLSAIDVSEALARIGAEYDVDVGPDATAFTLTTLSRFAERGASLLAAIVTRPSLRDDDFDRLRQMRLDRLRQLKDLPGAVADRAFLRLVYGTHPYGHLAIGADAALRRLVLEDVVRFHAATFRPAQATLVVAGDLPCADLLRIGGEAFTGWNSPAAANGQPGETTPAADIEPAVERVSRLAIVPRESAAQSEIRVGHLSARRNNPDYPALLVMNGLLGGQFVSRINLKLREEKGFTYGARTGFDWHRGLAPFSVQASVDTAATAEAIRDAITEIADLRGDRPPSAAEMNLAQASLTRGYPRNFETTPQVARSVAQLALYGLPDTYFEQFVPNVHNVTADDVVAAARTYLDPSRLMTVVVGDHAAVGSSLRALALGEPEVLPLDA